MTMPGLRRGGLVFSELFFQSYKNRTSARTPSDVAALQAQADKAVEVVRRIIKAG